MSDWWTSCGVLFAGLPLFSDCKQMNGKYVSGFRTCYSSDHAKR